MKMFGLILLIFCMGTGICSCSGQSALGKYIYASQWTPVTDHATDVTPGLIIAVNLANGSWELIDLQDDETVIPLETLTVQLETAQPRPMPTKPQRKKILNHCLVLSWASRYRTKVVLH